MNQEEKTIFDIFKKELQKNLLNKVKYKYYDNKSALNDTLFYMYGYCHKNRNESEIFFTTIMNIFDNETTTPKLNLKLSEIEKNSIKREVYAFKTKFEQGFLKEEISKLMALQIFGGRGFSNLEKYFRNITISLTKDQESIYHHVDVLNAIICSIEDRELNQSEFD